LITQTKGPWKRRRQEHKGPKVFTTFQPQRDSNNTSKVIFDPKNLIDGEMFDLYHEINKEISRDGEPP
jgi:hypothetical protein